MEQTTTAVFSSTRHEASSSPTAQRTSPTTQKRLRQGLLICNIEEFCIDKLMVLRFLGTISIITR